jgi:hypothetical protein
MSLKVKKLDEERSILVLGGKPALIEIVTREASSAPDGTRLKASLTAKYSDDDGDHEVLLPFAVPVLGGMSIKTPVGVMELPPSGFTPEWRMEMN